MLALGRIETLKDRDVIIWKHFTVQVPHDEELVRRLYVFVADANSIYVGVSRYISNRWHGRINCFPGHAAARWRELHCITFAAVGIGLIEGWLTAQALHRWPTKTRNQARQGGEHFSLDAAGFVYILVK